MIRALLLVSLVLLIGVQLARGATPAPAPATTFKEWIALGTIQDVTGFCKGIALAQHHLTLAKCITGFVSQGGTPTARRVVVSSTHTSGAKTMLHARLDGAAYVFELHLVGGRWLVYDWHREAAGS